MGCGSAPGTCIWAALVDGGHARRSRSACRISQTGVLSPFRPLYLRQPATFSLLIGANHGITGGAPRDTYERYPISVQPNRRANAAHRSARRKGPRAQLACPPARRRDRTADGPPAPSARAGDHPPSHGGPGCAVRLVARRRETRPSAPGRAGPRSPTLVSPRDPSPPDQRVRAITPVPPMLVAAANALALPRSHPDFDWPVFQGAVESRKGAWPGPTGSRLFPFPAHQTGRALFEHPAFRQTSPSAHGSVRREKTQYTKFPEHNFVRVPGSA